MEEKKAAPEPEPYNPRRVWVPTEIDVKAPNGHITHQVFRTTDGQIYLRNKRTGSITSAPKVKGKAARRAQKKARHLVQEKARGL